MSGTTSTDADSDLKFRLHRLLWYQGYFVRRSVAVSAHVVGAGHKLERKDVTDVDVLGIRFNENLQPQIVLAECKTGRHYEALDRTFWLAGLMRFLHADHGYLVVDSPQNLATRIAPELGISVIDGARMAAWEKSVLPDAEWRSSFDPKLDAELDAQLDKVKATAYREFYYVKYRFWQEDAADQLKHLVSVGRDLGANRKVPPESLRWFLSLLLPAFGLAIVNLSCTLFSSNPEQQDEFIRRVVTEWHGGEMSERRHQAQIEAFRDLLKQELTAVGAAERQTEIQSFVPEPGYVSTSLADLIARLIRSPNNAAELPRFLDKLLFDFVLRGATPSASAFVRDFGMGHDLHTIAKFAGNAMTLFGEETGLNVTEFVEATKIT